MKILKSVHNLVHAPLNVMESVGEMFLTATKRNDKLETAVGKLIVINPT